MPAKFDWRTLERKWQRRWAWSRVFETDPSPRKPKYFVTAAYPYPNSPQHVGHGRTYTMADVNARFHRMRGFNTLFPMGFQYTGTPIFAMCKRLIRNDPEIVRTFTEVYGIPGSKLEDLKDPLRMARYFHEEIREGMKEIGFSIDWRREFTTIDSVYTRFIEWQFKKLREKGLITRGTHPVAWCPNDNSPVGQVDTMGGVEPEISEFFLVKFEKDGVYYPTATLRPETIFGVTNLWINPRAHYVQARVDGEPWVVSREAVHKLRHQNRKVDIETEVLAKDLLGGSVDNPVTKTGVPILPGDFVEAGNGTGVVMSVPGHAPYDYQALSDLKAGPEGVPPRIAQDLKDVEPISMIHLEGYSDVPAADIVKKFQVKNQKDPRLEDATKELYSREFHQGVMKENTGTYAGMTVAKARDAIVQDLSHGGQITRLFEILNRPVMCRCGTECVVHILENQWFINYGDQEWKKLAHRCLDQMTLLPEELRGEFNYVVDWLREKACARKVGLGTRLPWDKDWVIEALSDSVIYMAYYILAKHLSKEWMSFKKFEKDPTKLPDSFFDYTFLGEGSAKDVAREAGIPARLLETIRKEFLYFYPVDARHSGKDLVPNHLAFYIFNHAVLFPPQLWPKGIAVNGFVLMEGTKMSKSLENIIPLRQGVAKFGADPVRIGVLATAEPNQDTDFSETLVRSIQDRLANLLMQARKLRRQRKAGRPSYSRLDRWMLSRLNEAVETTTKAMESLRVREVVNRVLYQLDNDLAWYQRRSGPEKANRDARREVLRRVLETRARMLSPLAPHTSEEIWSHIGGRGLVARASWPEPDDRLRDPAAEQIEGFIRQVLEDTGEILKATGLTPRRILYYATGEWKWRIYLQALEAAEEKQPVPEEFIKEIMSDAKLRRMGRSAADYAARAIQQTGEMPEELRRSRVQAGRLKEEKVLRDALDFLAREFKSEVEVWQEGDVKIYDPRGRARLAEPYRPAIFIE